MLALIITQATPGYRNPIVGLLFLVQNIRRFETKYNGL